MIRSKTALISLTCIAALSAACGGDDGGGGGVDAAGGGGGVDAAGGGGMGLTVPATFVMGPGGQSGTSGGICNQPSGTFSTGTGGSAGICGLGGPPGFPSTLLYVVFTLGQSGLVVQGLNVYSDAETSEKVDFVSVTGGTLTDGDPDTVDGTTEGSPVTITTARRTFTFTQDGTMITISAFDAL